MEEEEMRRSIALVLLGFAMLLGAAAIAAEKDAQASAPRRDVLYSCACGPDCSCAKAALEPGKCKCGKPLAWGHTLKIEGADAFVCTCKEGCTCKLDPKDPTKCGCGEKLKKVSLKGSGLYACACGPTCTCNTVSGTPGKCGCGKDLTKFD
jgi:hypothetical protein